MTLANLLLTLIRIALFSPMRQLHQEHRPLYLQEAVLMLLQEVLLSLLVLHLFWPWDQHFSDQF